MRLSGLGITSTAAPSRVVGKFLFRIGELAKGIAIQFAGTVGQRGPIRAGDVGELAIARLAWEQSVDLGFTVEGEASQLSFLTAEGGPMRQAAEVMAELPQLATDEKLIERARELGERVAKDYLDLLNLLITEQIALGMRSSRTSTFISPDRAERSRTVLDRTGPSSQETFRVIGTLYEAEAIRRGFRLDPDEEGQRVIQGTFPDQMREAIRQAWGRRVVAEVERTEKTLARSTQPRVSWELVGLQMLGEDRSNGDPDEPLL